MIGAIRPSDVTPHERYKLLTAFVRPRPTAWVTTVGPSGVVKAAPSVGRMFADRYCRTNDRMEFQPAPVVQAKAAE
jgi:hypothetical protein